MGLSAFRVVFCRVGIETVLGQFAFVGATVGLVKISLN